MISVLFVTAVFNGRGKILDFIGFLGWRCRFYTLFTPLEDRIGRQDVWNDKRYVLKIRNWWMITQLQETKRLLIFLQKQSWQWYWKLYNNINRTHHASDFSCATRWDFLIYGVFYVSISKTNINNRTAGAILCGCRNEDYISRRCREGIEVNWILSFERLFVSIIW